jgi:hypothetical protein
VVSIHGSNVRQPDTVSAGGATDNPARRGRTSLLDQLA